MLQPHDTRPDCHVWPDHNMVLGMTKRKRRKHKLVVRDGPEGLKIFLPICYDTHPSKRARKPVLTRHWDDVDCPYCLRIHNRLLGIARG